MPHRGFTTLLILGVLAFLIASGVVGYISLKNSSQQKSTGSVVPTTQTSSGTIQNQTPSQEQVATSSINETSYYVEDGKLKYWNDNVSEILYTFPAQLTQEFQDATTSFNEMGGAVGVPGKQGEYYLSVYSGHTDGRIPCGTISNKIYVLNTNDNTATLFYEETPATLSTNDFRACDKDMEFIGTEGTNLIILYHTIGTGGPCDYPWAYPDWIYYLDTMNSSSGTKKFTVPKELYDKAVQDTKDCQQSLMNS